MSDIFSKKEGGLDAPTRNPVKWKDVSFYEKNEFLEESERVYDVCHTCRRCVSLCESFPTLFDLIDESKTYELDSVDKEDFQKVVDECYMCDLCYQTKCPYVPPHPWAIDFPHLMLRGKAIAFKEKQKSLLKRFRDKILTSTDTLGKVMKIPLVDITYDWFVKNPSIKKKIAPLLGVHADAPFPKFDKTVLNYTPRPVKETKIAGPTTGKVSIFAGCYCRNNEPGIANDLKAVLEHNNIEVKFMIDEKCCGMPKLDLGDLESVEKSMLHNLPLLLKEISQGFDVISLVPSCVLMFKQELPLIFSENEDLQKIKKHIFDPFEYLSFRDEAGLLEKDFKSSLGKISYQVACHQRVQNIGPKTKNLLEMIPETQVETIERCSGHDGTYAVKKETHKNSVKIARPVSNKVDKAEPDYLTSDCPLAAEQIKHVSKSKPDSAHPISLLKKAYGME
jgi:glycerol-3-phosphate dehydrogenase subunit C|tara:strand:- start:1713 stop:3059 length:1347 start_codon:yes stop_codon:yes gene_type:complete